jgi:hypothetical protein
VSVADAAASGDRVTILRAMRDVLAARLDDPDARDASAVARELRAVLSELAEGPAEEADFVDELRARRAKAASGKRPAKG